MNRQIVYPGQIPQDTDLLNTNKNAMVAICKLAAAALGVNGVVNGLAVVPTGPASLNVNVNAGEIYQLQYIDPTSYGSIAADTTHQVLKQGILLDAALLSCPAPGTVGQSINYLIQAAFSETDTGAVALPYYNSANPSVAWSGPANSGTPQATQRTDACVVTVVAGAAATTGTQTTPAPSAGNIGLAVVTVANGQATITAGNIVQYTGASLVPSDGLASNVAHAIYTKSVAGNTDVVLTAQEAAFPIITINGALTGNINLIVPASSRQRIINNVTTGAFQVTVKTAAGTGVVVPQGYCLPIFCDGTNVLSQVSALLTQAQADARYAALAGLATQLFSVANAIAATHAVNLQTGDGRYAALAGLATQLFSAANGTAGNQVVNFSQVFGLGQTRQNVTGSRSVGSTYTNSTTKPIFISIVTTESAVSISGTLTVGGIVSGQFSVYGPGGAGASAICTYFAMVLPGETYVLAQSGATLTVNQWIEIR